MGQTEQARTQIENPPRILQGQTALVTGGNTGIGKAIALAMGRAGANVAINYRTEHGALPEMIRTLEDTGSRGVGFQADVSDEEEVIAMFRQVVDEFGALDILVNNAGLQQDNPFEQMTLSQWRQVIDVNLTGQFLCTREAVNQFNRQGVDRQKSCAAGKVLCISSVHEWIPWAGHVNYASSKGGIGQFMKSVAQEVAHHKIRVNSIAPGAIKTKINADAWSTPEAKRELLKMIPYQRVGVPEDVARVAVWLVSDEADYITGASIVVDGGMSLYPGFSAG